MELKRAWGVVVALVLTGSVSVRGGSQPSAPHHCLWKIQGDHCRVYLLGSMHLLKPENYPLPAALEMAYSNSPVVVFETDLGKLEAPEMQDVLLRQSRLALDQTLAQELPPDTYQRLHELLKQTGLPEDTLDRLKPAIAAVALQELELQQFGFSSDYGVDRHFYQKALRDHKRIRALEPVDFQVGLLTGLTSTEGESLMDTSLEELTRARKIFGELLGAWQTGDLRALDKLLNQSRRETPSLFERLVVSRNRDWAGRITWLLRNGQDAVVVVGAAHLAGENGLIELLKRRGFDVFQE